MQRLISMIEHLSNIACHSLLFATDHEAALIRRSRSPSFATVQAGRIASRGSRVPLSPVLTRRFWLSHFGDWFERDLVAHPLELLDSAQP